MLAEAVVADTRYNPDLDRTTVTLRFTETEASLHASAFIFEYSGKPKACHQPEGVLKIDLTGGDALKHDAHEKISNLLPAIIPTLGNKAALGNLMKSFNPKQLFGLILGAFNSEQLAELEVQIAEERKKRG